MHPHDMGKGISVSALALVLVSAVGLKTKNRTNNIIKPTVIASILIYVDLDFFGSDIPIFVFLVLIR